MPYSAADMFKDKATYLSGIISMSPARVHHGELNLALATNDIAAVREICSREPPPLPDTALLGDALRQCREAIGVFVETMPREELREAVCSMLSVPDHHDHGRGCSCESSISFPWTHAEFEGLEPIFAADQEALERMMHALRRQPCFPVIISRRCVAWYKRYYSDAYEAAKQYQRVDATSYRTRGYALLACIAEYENPSPYLQDILDTFGSE